MDLPTAQLGSAPSIQSSGYVPAPAYRPRLSRELLQAFLQGAGGAAGQQLTQAALTPDMSAQMNADQQIKDAGLAPGQRNAFQRFFEPMSTEQLDKAKSLAQTGEYQKLMGGLEGKRVGIEGKRVGIEQQSADTAKLGQQSTAAYQTAEEKTAADRLAQEQTQFGQTLPLDAARTAAATKVSDAQVLADTATTRDTNASATQKEILNRRVNGQYDQATLVGLEQAHPEIDHTTADAVLANPKVGSPSTYFRNNPNASNSDYENAFMGGAQAFNKARGGNPGAPVKPMGLGALLSNWFQNEQGGPAIGPPGQIGVNGPTVGSPTPFSLGAGGPASAPMQGTGSGVISPQVMQAIQEFMKPHPGGPVTYTPMGQ